MDALPRAERIARARLWRLPLWPDHAALLASTVADPANVSSTLQHRSMMTAASFLAASVGDWRWAHLDIYNSSWNTAEDPILPKGPTASGTRTPVRLLIERAGGEVL